MSNDTWTKLHGKLRNVLADLYGAENTIRRIVDDAGLENSQIAYEGNARDIWHKIISEAIKKKSLKKLLPVAMGEYYENQELWDVVCELIKYHSLGKQLNGEQPHPYYEEIEVPIVIAAMKRDQADELSRETILRKGNVGRDHLAAFRRFHKELRDQGTPCFRFGSMTTKLKFSLHLPIEMTKDVKECYKDEHEAWKPLYCDCSIKDIIDKALTQLSQTSKTPNRRKFKPIFISNSFFSLDDQERTDAAKQLKERGILVIDAISWFHPDLHTKIADVGIGMEKHVAILVISPFNATDIPLNKEITDFFRTNLSLAYSRFDKEHDHLCEIGMGNIRDLERLFIRTIRAVADSSSLFGPNSDKTKEAEKIGGAAQYVDPSSFSDAKGIL